MKERIMFTLAYEKPGTLYEAFIPLLNCTGIEGIGVRPLGSAQARHGYHFYSEDTAKQALHVIRRHHHGRCCDWRVLRRKSDAGTGRRFALCGPLLSAEGAPPHWQYVMTRLFAAPDFRTDNAFEAVRMAERASQYAHLEKTRSKGYAKYGKRQHDEFLPPRYEEHRPAATQVCRWGVRGPKLTESFMLVDSDWRRTDFVSREAADLVMGFLHLHAVGKCESFGVTTAFTEKKGVFQITGGIARRPGVWAFAGFNFRRGVNWGAEPDLRKAMRLETAALGGRANRLHIERGETTRMCDWNGKEYAPC